MTKKKAAKKTAKAKKSARLAEARERIKKARKPRPQRLPGMEDSGIQELENLANDMADVIAAKKESAAQEKNLNEQLVAAMKKHGKTSYSHAGIHIQLSASEKAKVVIKESEDDTPADPGDAPSPDVSAESMVEHAGAA